MNSRKLSLLIASSLATGALVVGCLPVVTATQLPEAKKGERFVAAIANCQVQEVHTWGYPAGYIRGVTVTCDVVSKDPRVEGRITFDEGCPVKATIGCAARFRLESTSGARWEGAYNTVMFDDRIGLSAVGRGGGSTADTQIMLDIYSLPGAEGWGDGEWKENVIGRIITPTSP
jgi:hypothetical protein